MKKDFKRLMKLLKDAFTPVGSRVNEFKYQKEKNLKKKLKKKYRNKLNNKKKGYGIESI